MSKHEIVNCLVRYILVGAIDVDWRDFFPYLKWIPNRRFETQIEQINNRKMAVINSLVQAARKRSSS